MHACMHACMHSPMNASMHICPYAWMHSPLHACIHLCMHAFTSACMHSPMHTCMHILMYACTCAYACMHAFIYFCMHAPVRMHASMHACMHRFLSVGCICVCFFSVLIAASICFIFAHAELKSFLVSRGGPPGGPQYGGPRFTPPLKVKERLQAAVSSAGILLGAVACSVLWRMETAEASVALLPQVRLNPKP